MLSCRAKPETSPTTTRRPSVAVCATLVHANVFSRLYFLLETDKGMGKFTRKYGDCNSKIILALSLEVNWSLKLVIFSLRNAKTGKFHRS